MRNEIINIVNTKGNIINSGTFLTFVGKNECCYICNITQEPKERNAE